MVLAELTTAGRALSSDLFGSMIDLVELAATDPDLPGPQVIQCLIYTVSLLERAAQKATTGPTLETSQHGL